jgi:hypothetical protein
MYEGSYSETTRKQMISILKENNNFDSLHDVIVNFFESLSDMPEDQQEVVYEKLLMNLPDTVLGDMYSWGFSDTVVRDNLYEFIEDNKEEVSTLIGLV